MDLRWDDSGFAERCDSYIEELAGVLGHADRHLSFRYFVGQPPWSSDGLLASVRSSVLPSLGVARRLARCPCRMKPHHRRQRTIRENS